jgi:magnesium chelatase family protein
MVGPPGSGKTMVAKSLTSILPDLTEEESIEVTKIYSLVGRIPPDCGLLKERPFRSPHHTISYAGMIGGGNNPTPGEITLAHRGVLFMDEFSEFSRPVLESLRQPMESGKITVSRSRFSVDFPSNFMLIASSNPCPCGYYGDQKHECRCTDKRIKNYQSKLSGPILDRIDIHLNVFPVDKERLLKDKNFKEGESSVLVRDRVLKARKIQQLRFKNEKIFSNNEMINLQIEKYCKMDSVSKKLLIQATERFGLSTRAYFKLIKVARTIADLDGKENICLEHIAEAVQYRSKLFL